MAELKKLAKEELYGGILSISRDEFIKEVTESSKDCWVGVFLWGDNRESRIVEDMIKRVANKFRTMKFVSIKGNLCIDKFPDKYVTSYSYVFIIFSPLHEFPDLPVVVFAEIAPL